MQLVDEQPRQKKRKEAVSDHKRALILKAAREVFEQDGLEGASLRAIAARSGYTPAALYFHFASKEEIYAAVLHNSLSALGAAVDKTISSKISAEERLRGAAMAFFDFYAENPRDLDLGFYLFRGGMKPSGLGGDRDEALNISLAKALKPIAQAAEDLGASKADAEFVMVDVFAHATGLLLLLHTGRIRMFNASARELMDTYVENRMQRVGR